MSETTTIAKVITPQNAKNSLKFAAAAATGLLTVTLSIVDTDGNTVGTKVAKLNHPARILMLDDATKGMLSFPSFSEMVNIVAVDDHFEVVPMGVAEDCTELVSTLAPKGEKSKNTKAIAEINPELLALLQQIPAGFKLTTGKDGSPKLVATRNRTAKEPATTTPPAPATTGPATGKKK